MSRLSRSFLVLFLSVCVVSVELAPTVAAFSFTNVTENSSEPGRDLVAIVVDKALYDNDNDFTGLQEKYDGLSDDTFEDRIERYAEDVRKSLPETKTLILPIVSDENTAWKLQQILERLYFEGDPDSDVRTQLRGVVLVGDVPLPAVQKNGNRFVSLYPYTDFSEKSSVWNATAKSFEFQPTVTDPRPEVWHGIIRASSVGAAGLDQLATYFDKNHLYHVGNPEFSKFDRRILMSDLVSEQKNLNPSKYPMYENFLKNMEDLAYNRYTAKWLSELQKKFSSEFGEELKMIDEMLKGFDTSDGKKALAEMNKFLPPEAIAGQKAFVESLKNGGAPAKGMKDILAAPMIQKFHIPYIGVFGNYLSKINDFVSNTGRWDTKHVDSPVTLITQEDLFAQQFLLQTNTILEDAIDAQIAKVEQRMDFPESVEVRGSAFGKSFGLRDVNGNLTQDFVLFSNHSLLRQSGAGTAAAQQFVHGVAVADVSNAGQCLLTAGSTQRVQSVRALNPRTMNFSPIVTEKNLDARVVPSFGVSVRTLLADEAKKITNGKYRFGAVVTEVFPGNLGAGKPFFKKNDVILFIDDAKISASFPVEFALMSHHPGIKVVDNGFEVNDFAKVQYISGGKELTSKVNFLNANDPTWYGGCDGTNFQHPEKCFPFAASRPVNDFSGTVALADDASGVPEQSACFDFRPYESPLRADPTKSPKDFLSYYDTVQQFLRDDTDGTKKSPLGANIPGSLPALDPKETFLLWTKDVAYPHAVTQFTVADFLNLLPEMNRKDENGNFVDTNGNGVQDQIAWVDLNENGKLDLCPKEAPNVVAYQQNFSGATVIPLAPKISQGVPCTGGGDGKTYSGEFIGGDYGVDEPGEKEVGDVADWNTFLKLFSGSSQPQFFSTPRRIQTGGERFLTLKALGVEGDEAAELQGADALAKESSDFRFEFTPNIAKQISSMIAHKEPTAPTLQSQFQSMLSDVLPIDKPRFVTYQNAGGVTKFLYPNAFAAATLDEFLKKLDEAESALNLSKNSLRAGLDLKRLEQIFDWKNLSLNEKHAAILSRQDRSFEAWYFVGNGDANHVALNFSGNTPGAILEDSDPTFQKLLGGGTVTSPGTAPAGIAGSPPASSGKGGDIAQETFYNEPLSIFEFPDSFPWFEGLKKWQKDIQAYFDKGVGSELSFGDGDGGAGVVVAGAGGGEIVGGVAGNDVGDKNKSHGAIALSATNYSLPAGGGYTTLTATLKDADGKILPYDGAVSFSSSDAGMLFATNGAPTKFINGTANFVLQSGKKAGSATVTVSAPQLSTQLSTGAMAALPILVLPLSPKRFEIVSNFPDIQVQLVDTFGNPVQNNIPVNFRVTDSTAAAATFMNQQKTVTNNSAQGVAHATLFPTMQGGRVNVIVSSAGMESGMVTVDTPTVLSSSQFTPNTLFANLIGSDFGNITRPNSFAADLLHTSRTQVVTASLFSEKSEQPVVMISPDGGLLAPTDETTFHVIPSQDLEPLRIDLFHVPSKKSLGEMFVRGATVTSRVTTSDAAFGVRDGSGAFTLHDKDIVKINAFGGLSALDPNVSFQWGRGGTEGAGAERHGASALFAGTEIGVIDYALPALSPVQTVTDVSQISSDAGVAVLTHADALMKFSVVPFFAGASTFSGQGISFVEKGRALEISQKPLVMASSEGAGFLDSQKQMLLLAAGNTVGNSFLYGASESSVTVGDPTVRLSHTNPASQTGFTKDIGSQIFSGNTPIRFVAPIRFSSPKQKDLLIGYENGEIRLLERSYGESPYRDRGRILLVKNGIFDAVVTDIDGDSLDDLIVANKEACTLKESCTDLYRNTKGAFVRENLDLGISKKIIQMKVADMNLDGSPDLLAADEAGAVRIFWNQKGIFQKNGIVLGSFPGAPVMSISDSFPALVKDSFPDVLVVSAAAGENMLTYFSTSDGRTYKKIEKKSEQTALDPDAQQLKDQQFKDDAKEAYPPPTKGAKTSVTQAALLQELSVMTQQDSDGDGVPNSFDALSGDVISSVEDMVSKLRCAGGCIPMPINFAFFAPGAINAMGVPVGFDPGLPVFGWGGTCPVWTLWPGCPYQLETIPGVGGRLYLSPTLTGGLGFAVCLGPYLGAQCYAFPVPVQALAGGMCEELSDGITSAYSAAKSFSSFTPGGYDSVVAYGNGPSDFSQPTGSFGGDVSLGKYKVGVKGSTNIRVPGFPSFITDWLDRQTEEALDKLADLPDLYLIYPSISSITGSVLPKIPSGKMNGYTQFLTYLNSIPLIKIEPREVNVRLPAISPSQILRMKNDLEQWKVDFETELERIKKAWNLLDCLKNPKLSVTEAQLCSKISVNGGLMLQRVEQNIQTLDAYAQFPKKLLEFRNIETKYLRQIIGYLDTITQFTGGYIQRQQKRIEQWMEAIKKVKNILNNWQAFIDLTLEYETSCDECKTDKFSLMQMLIQIFVQIPTPPIIEFPKWPDIVMDFSKIQAGVTVIWPDIVFTPAPLLIPTLPRIQFPDLFTLNFPDLNLMLNFEGVIPLLPQPPELPVFPDLPPLPVFKLPDLPPAPKIPDLGAFPLFREGIDLLKKILKIVCLIKTGIISVPESGLKTQIENLTQRSLTPPLPIDLSIKIDPPALSYKFVEQIKLEGRANFQIQTQMIYDLVKSFADLANAMTTNLTDAANQSAKSTEKAVKKLPGVSGSTGAVPKEIRLIAEGQRVDAESFGAAGFEGNAELSAVGGDRTAAGHSYLSDLSKNLRHYLASRDSHFLTDEMMASKSLFASVPLRRYLAANSGLQGGGRQGLHGTIALATTASAQSGEAGTSGKSDAALSGLGLQGQGLHAPLPIGIFIQNPVSEKPELLMNYTREIPRGTLVEYTDFDNDSDSDAIVVFGGDVFVKRNILQDSEEESFDEKTRVASVDELMPKLPSVNHLQTLYSENGSVGISWDVPTVPMLAGYDVLIRSATGVTRKRLVFEDAPKGLKEASDTEIIAFDRSASSTHFDLVNGNYYLQMRAFDREGHFGTVSDVIHLGPQICGDMSEPALSLGRGGNGGTTYRTAILKPLTIHPNSSEANVTFFADLNLTKDDNGDKDLTNDHNANGSATSVTIGPFTETFTKKIKIWALDASGNTSGEEANLEVYKPDIVIESVDVKTGTASGFTSPLEPGMPFSLIRKRGGENRVLGSFSTDGAGRFTVNNLNVAKKTVLKNSAGQEVAEISMETGAISHLMKGYSVVVEPATLEKPNMIHVQDAQKNILLSFFVVPDVTAPVAIVDDFFAGAAGTGGASGKAQGALARDTRLIDAFSLKPVAANDSVYAGGVELVDSNTASRVAIIDPLGRIFILDPRFSLRVHETSSEDEDGEISFGDPFIFEILFEGKTVVAEVLVVTSGKLVTFLDSVKFAQEKPFSIAAATVTVNNPATVNSQTPFSDVKTSAPYYSAVQDLQQKGIIQGYQFGNQTLFKPDQALSRAEYTKIMLKTLCIEPRQPEAYEAPSVFGDVSFSQPLVWFYPFIKESFFRQLVTGYIGSRGADGKTLFKPLADITRAEAAKIFLEALRMLKVLVLDIKPLDPAIGPWYAPYIELSQNLTPYLKKPGTPNSFLLTPQEAGLPNHIVTRGEFAVMASRVLRAYNCYARSAMQPLQLGGSENNVNNSNSVGSVGSGGGNSGGVVGNQTHGAGALAIALPGGISGGVYGILPSCTSCPCISSLQEMSDMISGDMLFAVFSNADVSVIYQKSNEYTIP